MRVLVCGGRGYTNADHAWAVLTALAHEHGWELELAQGLCPTGADAFARAWARTNNVPCRDYAAEWSRFGPRAGPLRNQRMLDDFQPHLVVAFPGGAGTEDMVRRALRAGVKVVHA